MVAQVIAQATAAKGAAASEPRVEIRIPCAADRIGWVIGPSGATVKAIRTLSGAKLDMLEEVTSTGGRRGVVVVSGSADAVAEAKLALQGLLGAAHAQASKAYAAQLLEAAEARVAWDKEQRKAAAGPSGAAPAEGGGAAAEGGAAEAGEGEGAADATTADAKAAAAAAQQASNGWRQVTTKHPDGSELKYWLHEPSGMCRW
jgi:hypothetical protein